MKEREREIRPHLERDGTVCQHYDCRLYLNCCQWTISSRHTEFPLQFVFGWPSWKNIDINTPNFISYACVCVCTWICVCATNWRNFLRNNKIIKCFNKNQIFSQFSSFDFARKSLNTHTLTQTLYIIPDTHTHIHVFCLFFAQSLIDYAIETTGKPFKN